MCINGHDTSDLSKLKNLRKGLNAVILDTIKRKGIKIAGHGVKRRKPNRWYDKHLVDKQDMRNINEKWQEILKS